MDQILIYFHCIEVHMVLLNVFTVIDTFDDTMSTLSLRFVCVKLGHSLCLFTHLNVPKAH